MPLCGILLFLYIAAGAKCISEMMKVNSVLESLCLMCNDIGDDGTTAIAGALSKTSIKKLSLYNCGFAFTGAKVLAEGLTLNQSIRLLSVQENPVTVKGALLILQSSVDNNVCHKVQLNKEYKKDDGVMKLYRILRERRCKVWAGICML